MKKLICLLLASLLCLAGCSTTPKAPAAEGESLFKAGTYTGVGDGRNGPITVEVTFTAGAIESITVKEHTETAGICDPAIEKIPGAVEMWVANEEKNIDMIRIFDGIEELLEKLEKKGSTLGVVTSRTREELELVLDQLPIRKYFSICICADDTKEHKPSAQPLLKYMELSGARKEETVYIGDSASDMSCALNAGVDCVHAVWGEPETEADATYRAGKPEQLEEIFL